SSDSSLAVPSFPTRRSSDLLAGASAVTAHAAPGRAVERGAGQPCAARFAWTTDRAWSRWRAARVGAERALARHALAGIAPPGGRSEEHTSELQSRENLVCRL